MTMPRYRRIYESDADRYDELVSKEDYNQNLIPAIESLSTIRGKKIAEFGAGTARLTRLMAPHASWIWAFDSFPAMLKKGRAVVRERGLRNVTFELADNKSLPLASASVEMAVAGWTFGHCTSWYPDRWEQEIRAAVSEMMRVTRAGGSVIILETLGTGCTVPKEPNSSLAAYYSLLERDLGFARTWIRTDYKFDSKEQAEMLTHNFFGRSFPLESSPNGGVILPECTGIWSLPC
jgi:ubiquinone/menaquinone biosynthesis C-methylase UbiE